MKWCIYCELDDGTKTSDFQKGIQMRDVAIRFALINPYVKHVSYCKVYKSGEYSPRTFVS